MTGYWTYELAMAASRDAGNRSMKKAGRMKWNRDDWNTSVDTLDRLYPVEIRHIDPGALKEAA